MPKERIAIGESLIEDFSSDISVLISKYGAIGRPIRFAAVNDRIDLLRDDEMPLKNQAKIIRGCEMKKTDKRSVVVSVVSLSCYLLSGISDWSMFFHDVLCSALSDVVKAVDEPVDASFLSDIDLSDERSCCSALLYVFSMSCLKHGKEKWDIDPVACIQRLSSDSFNDGEWKQLFPSSSGETVRCFVTTGFIPVRQEEIDHLSFFKISEEEAANTLQFFLFLSQAGDEDIYHADKKHGEWQSSRMESCRIRDMFRERGEATLAMRCADGLTKKEIMGCVVPTIGCLKSFENSIDVLSSTLRTRIFANVDFAVEEATQNFLLISGKLKEQLFDRYDEETAAEMLWNILDKFKDDLSFVLSRQNRKTVSSSDIRVLLVLMRSRMAIAYLEEYDDAYAHIETFLLSFSGFPFSLGYSEIHENNLEDAVDIMAKVACLSKSMGDAQIANFLVSMGDVKKTKGYKTLDLNKWQRLCDLLACSDDVVFDWAYSAALSE